MVKIRSSECVKFSFLPTCAPFIRHIKMLKFTLKYLIFAATYFGPPEQSSESLRWAWLKLYYCRTDQ